MNKHLVAAGAAVAVMGTGSSVLESSCANRDVVVERQQTKYKETLAAGGLQKIQNSSSVLEVWATAETGTFTVMLTAPNGVTCVMATGTDWHQNPLLLKSVDAPKGAPS